MVLFRAPDFGAGDDYLKALAGFGAKQWDPTMRIRTRTWSCGRAGIIFAVPTAKWVKALVERKFARPGRAAMLFNVIGRAFGAAATAANLMLSAMLVAAGTHTRLSISVSDSMAENETPTQSHARALSVLYSRMASRIGTFFKGATGQSTRGEQIPTAAVFSPAGRKEWSHLLGEEARDISAMIWNLRDWTIETAASKCLEQDVPARDRVPGRTKRMA